MRTFLRNSFKFEPVVQEKMSFKDIFFGFGGHLFSQSIILTRDFMRIISVKLIMIILDQLLMRRHNLKIFLF